MHRGNNSETRMLLTRGKERHERRKRKGKGKGDMTFLFRSVNNTFLQISHQREINIWDRDYGTRNTEREREKRDGHRCARVPSPLQGTLLNDIVIGYSILISYIDTYPLCGDNNKPCLVILHVISHPPPPFCRKVDRPKTSWEQWRAPRTFLKGVDIVHINFNPPPRASLLWL